GNVESEKSRLVKVDTRSPDAVIDKPEKDLIQVGFNSEDSCRVSGRGSDRNGLKSGTLYIDGKKVQTNGGKEFQYIWDLSRAQEGEHNICWVVEDKAGNTGRAEKKVSVGNFAKDWYFAEGNTLPEFDEYICILNPGDKPAKVLLSFMLEDGSMISAERHMAPSQRDTVRVKDIVPEGHNVSAKVHCSEQAIVCERPMYFIYRNRWKGGHNVMGTNVLQREWYFSEGTTRKNPVDGEFEPWLCLMNSSFEQSASVEVCYMLSSGQNIVKRYGVPPHSRKTIEIENDIGINQDVATKVSSDLPLAAELPMYFNYHGFAVDGSNVAGATSPSNTWYFAEGATHPGFEEWLTIQNPNGQMAKCEITYMTGTGAKIKSEEIVPPMSRATVDVLAQVGDNQDVSAKVTSDVPIIAARPMYFLYGAQGWSGGEASLGNPAPSTRYFLAEGTCRTGFDTWYTLQNPSDTEQCDVEIKYVFPDGSSKKEGYRINPHSRLTIFVNEVVGRGIDVSACISASSKVVVERPIYFNYGGVITGGHNVLGFGTD
ncbi:MAG: hypothetical protein PHO53_05905, partial [Actinomycetota bacterium]|nr:hypothetical protein [Actinomycetota bacterium]